MAGKSLDLNVLFGAVDKLTGPLKNITQASKRTAQALKKDKSELAALNKAQRQLGQFKELSQGTKQTSQRLKEQQDRVKDLTHQIENATGSTKRLERTRQSAIKQQDKLTHKHDKESQKLKELQSAIRKTTGSTGNLEEQERILASRVQSANQKIQRQQKALKLLGQANIGGKFRHMTSEITRLTRRTALLATGAGAAIFGLANSTAGLGDKLDKNAKAWGITTQQIQGYHYAAELAGMSTASFDSNFEKFVRRVGQAAKGKGSAKNAFKALGLDAEQLAKHSPKEALDAVADALKNVKGHTQKVQIATDIFGRRGAKMVTMLENGSHGLADMQRKAEDLGYVLSKKTVSDSDKFATALEGAQASLKGLKNTIGAELIPVVTDLMKSFTQWMSENRDQVAAFARAFGDKLKAAVPILKNLAAGAYSVFKTMTRVASKVSDWVGGFRNLGIILAALFAGKAIASIFSFGGAVVKASRAIWLLNAAMFANPIGLIVAAIAVLGVAAYEVYKHWDGISQFFANIWGYIKSGFSAVGDWLAGLWNGIVRFFGRIWDDIAGVFSSAAKSVIAGFKAAWNGLTGFFGDLWTRIKQAVSGGIAGLAKLLTNWSPLDLLYRAITSALEALGAKIPEQFKHLGSSIVDGIIGGITGGVGHLKDTIMGMGSKAVGWFKDKLGIHSPSRVFAELGGHTLEGYRQGLMRSESRVLSQMAGIAGRLTTAGGGFGGGLAFDSRPALQAVGALGGGSVQVSFGDVYVGSQEEAQGFMAQVQAAVQQALDNRDRQAAARSRSALYDRD